MMNIFTNPRTLRESTTALVGVCGGGGGGGGRQGSYYLENKNKHTPWPVT